MDIRKLNNATRKVKVSFYKPYKVDSDFIKAFRTAKNLSQIELANILGVTQGAVAQWESGKKKVNGSAVVLLSILYDNKDLFDEIYKVEIKE